MGFTDKVDNKLKHMDSRRSELAKVEEIRKTIEKENEDVKELLFKIGQHFWGLYDNGEYVPKGEDKELFDKIVEHNNNIKLMMIQIDECKMDGIRERDRIDEETAVRIQAKKEAADIRRQEKEAAAEAKRIEKIKMAEAKRIKKANANQNDDSNDGLI